MDKFRNKRIAIIGFGVEGQSVCDFLMSKTTDITVLDHKEQAFFDPKVLKPYLDKGIKFRFGKIENLRGFHIVFRSPGVRPDESYLIEAKKEGVEITSATKLFFELSQAVIIGVTGTKGKGTTSTLIYEMLKNQEIDVYLGGNIGVPPLSFISKLTKNSKVVLELSSFQLADLTDSPHIAVMLMTTSEHQDYHRDVYEYVEAKRNILRYQKSNDYAVINKDYPATRESDIVTNGNVYFVSREQEVEKGCYVSENKLILKMDSNKKEIFDLKMLGLKGKHNYENAMSATVASLLAGATMESIIPVLKSFRGLEHRIEYVATIKGVAYYDDSFSTTPETAIAAIESFDEPKILILGGSSKNSDFSDLGQVISDSDSIKAIIGIGVEWDRIKDSIKNQVSGIKYIEGLENMRDVVDKCQEIGEVGDVVLLSPACASFGMFKDYKDRGEQFKNEVKILKN